MYCGSLQGHPVFALNAGWGEGKSTFIKMWKGYIGKENRIRHIYFDAFENDYHTNTFLALATRIYKVINDEDKKEFLNQVIKIGKAVGINALNNAIRLKTYGVIDLNEIMKDLKNQDTMQEFKKKLKVYVAKIKVPFVFIIDELDRCRPDFSLEILEKIKHLFSVDGLTFLLVLNKPQLENAIKCRYGKDVDANIYLQKFIHVWLPLPRKYEEDQQNQQDDGVTYMRHLLESMLTGNEKSTQNKQAIEMLKVLIKEFKLSYRKIERIITNFALIKNMTENKFFFRWQLLLSFICFIKIQKPELINDIAKGEIDADTLLSKTGIKNNNKETLLEALAVLIKYDLAGIGEKAKLLENHSNVLTNEHTEGDENVMKEICDWFSQLKVS